MINNLIHLNQEFPMLEHDATLTSYCMSNHNEFPFEIKRRTILVIPGGGYEFVSYREAEPVALKFVAQNFNIFVLRYTVGDFVYPYPLVEAFAAIAYIRKHADKYNVDTEHIAVMGFSAGGHLAASICCYSNDDTYSNFLNISKDLLKFNGCLLSYPVITTNEFTHLGTKERITQNREDLIDYFSIENHAEKDFPPTFIWTTKDDTCVPYINSELMKSRLDKIGVYCECHIFDHGEHGGATCDDLTCDQKSIEELKDASAWIDLATKFIKEKM